MTSTAQTRRLLKQGWFEAKLAEQYGRLLVGEPEHVPTESPTVRLFNWWEAAQAEEYAAHEAMQREPFATNAAKEEIYETFGGKQRAIGAAILAEPARCIGILEKTP